MQQHPVDINIMDRITVPEIIRNFSRFLRSSFSPKETSLAGVSFVAAVDLFNCWGSFVSTSAWMATISKSGSMMKASTIKNLIGIFRIPFNGKIKNFGSDVSRAHVHQVVDRIWHDSTSRRVKLL